MNYFNPFSAFPRINQPQKPQFNVEQFKQVVPNLTPEFLNQITQMARARGISEADIESGLQLINNLK